MKNTTLFLITILIVGLALMLNTSQNNEHFNKVYISLDEASIINKKLNKLLLNNDTNTAETIIQKRYTDSLLAKKGTENYDTLNSILIWANSINNYSEIGTKNKFLYKSISNFWYEKAAEILENNSDDKNTFKHKYLVQKCIEQEYYPDIKTTNIEKVINNIVESNWYYLLNRIWNRTGIIFKITLLIIGTITIISYINTVITIKNRINGKKKSI